MLAFNPQLKRTLTIAMLGLLALSSAFATSFRSKWDAPLQELADNAALAGVISLATGAGLSDAERIQASISAVRNAIAGSPSIARDIFPSIDDLSLSVVLENPGAPTVSSVAHYIPPSPGHLSQHSADVSGNLSIKFRKRMSL